MLNSKLDKLKSHFGIRSPEDWCRLEPADIRGLRDIGPRTLDYIRVLLAARGLTLKNDRTPEWWQQHLPSAKMLETMGDDDRQVICPFTILIDTAEQHPWPFTGIPADGYDVKSDGEIVPRIFIVPTERRALGRHPESMGDYSIDGFVGKVAIERKSVEDLQSTILGWSKKGDDDEIRIGRRERFEHELEAFSEMEAALVIVEGGFGDAIRTAPGRGRRSSADNGKIICRSILAYMKDYPVRWVFCDWANEAGAKRLAEICAFRFFYRHWEKVNKVSKENERLLAAM